MTLTYPELVFKPENHTYWLNGVYVPGVSEIMRPLSDSMYRNIDQNMLDTAAKRGSAIHEAVENYIKYGIDDCEPDFRPYFDAFLAWVKEERVEVIASEIPVYNKILRYAGTADILCNIKGATWLVDVKTTAQINHMLTGVQLVAYNAALASHGVKTDKRAVLQLRKDGHYCFLPEDKANDSEAWTTFGALLTVYGHIQKYKKG